MNDLHWLAGIIEGEGDLVRGGIRVSMGDRDVIERVATHWGLKVWGPYGPYSLGTIPMYRAHIGTRRGSAGWMMTLYSLMGHRRKAQIRASLAYWKARGDCPPSPPACHPDRPYHAKQQCKACYRRQYKLSSGGVTLRK